MGSKKAVEAKLAGVVLKEPGSKRTWRIRWMNQNSDTLVQIVRGRVYGALTPDAKRAVLAALNGGGHV